MSREFLMIPYDDEELYSWIVRQIKHSIHCNYRDILLELTGQRKYSRRHRYLGRIGYISESLNAVGYSPDLIINEMTLFNLVKPFIVKQELTGLEMLY